MPHGEDDPRQVLAILNSLGFIGITAEQLKSFMKDLKLHRKIKERQREQWQEETKMKILSKQREALAELINQNSSVNSHDVNDDTSSVVKIKIKCVTESDTNDEIENNEKCTRAFRRKQSQSPPRRQKKEKEIDVATHDAKECMKLPEQSGKRASTRSETVKIIHERTASAPELSEVAPRSRSRTKSVVSDSIARRNPSRSSCRSQSKSFIRPWKLHPEIQRPPQNVRSDPVLLYQQYQKEWNQRLLPGENRHAAIRWAVREKMLGANPTPRPMLKKSCSSMSVKRR